MTSPEPMSAGLSRLAAGQAEPAGWTDGDVWKSARRLLDARLADPALPVATILGDSFQAGLTAVERRERGTHFTPQTLARRVAGAALRAFGDGELPASILDPAMGAGAFLIAVLDVLMLRDEEVDCPARRKTLALELAHGMDIDPRAVELARASLWCWIGDPQLDPQVLSERLVCADALRTDPFQKRFDLVVANPPFLGGKRLKTVHGAPYVAELLERFPGASGNMDLAGFFLRRTVELLRPNGALGLIVTNSIAQGATRCGGLEYAIEHGITLTEVERRVVWPEQAGVVVSLIAMRQGPPLQCPTLDGIEVPFIDSFLSSSSRASMPRPHASMQNKAFIGCFLRGQGFIFEDDAGPGRNLEAATRLLAAEPSIGPYLEPLLGGAEVLSHPEQLPHRRVLRLPDEATLESLEQTLPRGIEHLRRHVKPGRDKLGSSTADGAHKRRWWLFANTRPTLFARVATLSHVIVVPRMSARLLAVRLEKRFVPTDQLVVVASESFAVLALLSSRLHQIWARRFCSTLGDGLRYTPQSAFETFPLVWGSFGQLEADAELWGVGEVLDQARRTLCRKLQLGLTKLYARLEQGDVRTALLAEAHAEVDRVVDARYGLEGADDTARLAHALRLAAAREQESGAR